MALEMYGKYNNAEEREIDAPRRKAKSEALKKNMSVEERNKAIDKKWAAYNASRGLTPTGKRKWHYYNTKI